VDSVPDAARDGHPDEGDPRLSLCGGSSAAGKAGVTQRRVRTRRSGEVGLAARVRASGSVAAAGEGSALFQSVLVGGTNLVFTMAAMAVIDRFGRRKLMIVGSIGYVASLSATAWAFYRYGTDFTPFGSLVVLASLLVFIASHVFGQGAVIWVFVSEIFPNRVRARGQVLGSFTHWVMAAGISWTFPMIAEASGGHAFAFYAAMMVVQLLWVLRVMPETKGVPLEDIQKRLGIS
jgi:SP family xylose:H+ symportor-like MFS transporter